MCSLSPQIEAALTDTIRQFLDQGRMFTGYDVTIDTRHRLGINLRHQDVRAEIHDIEDLRDAMDFGWDISGQTLRYARSQVTMPNGGWAFVYHPENMDPKGYRPRSQGQTQPVAATVSAPAPTNSISLNDGTTSDSGGQQNDGTFATDYRNRLLVPTKYMKEADMNPGDTVYVVADGVTKSVTIVKQLPANVLALTTQTVERNGDIRLSSKTLRAADLENAKCMIESSEKDLGGLKTKVVEVKCS